MSRARRIAGALVLCALAVGAFGVASASAAGLTAVECEERAGGIYKTSECLTPAAGTNFETVALVGPKVVEATLVSGTEVVLTGTVALAKVDISCKKATSTGTVKNVESGSPIEMRIEGTGGVAHYEECTARLSEDTGKNKEACKIEAITGGQGVGKITTASLKGITSANHVATAEPTEGTTFTEFKILKEAAEAGKTCAVPASTVKVTGKITGTANTEKHSHGTIAGGGTELKANGAAATFTTTTAAHTPAPNAAKVVGAMTF